MLMMRRHRPHFIKGMADRLTKKVPVKLATMV
jgi:hypothetical protein